MDERPASGPARPVLYVDHARALGGAERSLLQLLSALDRRRYEPVLACAESPLAEAARQGGVNVWRVDLPRLRSAWGVAAWWRGSGSLAHLVRETGAAILHGNTYRASLYAARAAGRASLPFVWHVRDLHRSTPPTVWLCRRAAAVIANSRAVAAALPCSARAVVIYNPVVLPPPQPRSRGELGLPDGDLIASIGILRPWKGHHDFLAVAAQVRAPAAAFLILGGQIHGDEERGYLGALQAETRRLGLAQRVHFLGHREDLADIWPHLAVLVHASHAEPFGRVAAEALLAGVPVVGFASGGLPEIVDDGETGFLVAPGDTGAMAAAVDRLLAEAELRSRFGALGRERALVRYAPDRHARAVEAVYDDMLDSRRQPGKSQP